MDKDLKTLLRIVSQFANLPTAKHKWALDYLAAECAAGKLLGADTRAAYIEPRASK